MGETGDSGHSPGCDDNGKKTTIPNEFRESCQEAPRFEIRADNKRFPSFVSPSKDSLLRHGTLNMIQVFFSKTRFLFELDLGLFF